MAFRALVILFLFVAAHRCVADEVLYRYEGDVFPYDESAGWIVANACDGVCYESIIDGHYVTEYGELGEGRYNHHYWIDRVGDPPPPMSLWVEWRYRSNEPKPAYYCSCDGHFVVRYDQMFEAVNLFGDAAFSFSCAYASAELEIEEFHTYRFENINGSDYWISVDGAVFIASYGNDPVGVSYLQFGSLGGCSVENFPIIQEWDMVRFGTIDSGERIIAADPPGGFLDPDLYPALDRFAVTFDSANYVYIDEITVETSGGITPTVTKTWRRDNDEPDTLEIVLDQPIPAGEHTRFIFNDGTTTNVVDYTYVLGDANGDGTIDLADVAVLQRCFGKSNPTGRCRAFDFNNDQTIDLTDYATLANILEDPQP